MEKRSDSSLEAMVKKLVCFVEEPSAKELLINVLRMLDVPSYQVIVFEGKQDLEKRLKRTLKAWQEPNCIFLILRDQDGGDCRQVKKTLLDLSVGTGKEAIVRIACHELETFYLGDLAAVEQGLEMKGISRNQEKKKFKDPDRLSNPAQELSRLTKGTYQKVLGSRKISQHLNLSKNRSRSFNILLKAIQISQRR